MRDLQLDSSARAGRDDEVIKRGLRGPLEGQEWTPCEIFQPDEGLLREGGVRGERYPQAMLGQLGR